MKATISIWKDLRTPQLCLRERWICLQEFCRSICLKPRLSLFNKYTAPLQPQARTNMENRWSFDEFAEVPFLYPCGEHIGMFMQCTRRRLWSNLLDLKKCAFFSLHHAGCWFLMHSHFFQERMTDALAISALGALSTGFAGSLSTAPGMKYVMKNCYHIRGWKLGLTNPSVDLNEYIWHGKRQSYVHFKDLLLSLEKSNFGHPSLGIATIISILQTYRTSISSGWCNFAQPSKNWKGEPFPTKVQQWPIFRQWRPELNALFKIT